jgi:hypothetical protein
MARNPSRANPQKTAHGRFNLPAHVQFYLRCLLAETLSLERGIKIDRLARRSKEFVICSLCEVARDIIAGSLSPLVKKERQELDGRMKSEPVDCTGPLSVVI